MTASIGKVSVMSAVCVMALAAGAVAGEAVKTQGACAGSACIAPATATDTQKAPAKETEAAINTAGLKALLLAKTPVAILDARTGKFDDGRRLPGAKALSPTATDKEITTALPEKGALIVTYCAGPKCKASSQLAAKLRGAGYSNLLEYHEGIAGWVDAGNTVEESK